MKVPDEPAADVAAELFVTIQLRCPDGSKLTRRFLKENTVGDVVNFYKLEKKAGIGANVLLLTSFPKKTLDD